MATKHYVVVEVLVEGTGDRAEFLNMKIEGQQGCPLPKDAPAPRRLVKDILMAALDSKHPANADALMAARTPTKPDVTT